MSDARWQKVREIFDSALRHKPEERRRFLNQVCGDDKTLLAEVESLLSSHDGAESFMETPAIAKVADVIEATEKLDRNVAIKILNEEFSQDEANLQRFVSEAKRASALNHPNILTIYEFGERKMRVLSSANIVTSKLIVLAATFVMTAPLPLLSLLLAFL